MRTRCASSRTVRRVTRRRAHRRRPSPIGVHARRAPDRTTPDRRATSPARSPPISRSPSTTACTRVSARSTSCRSSRSAEPRPKRRPRARRASSGSGGPRPTRCPCSSTTTPIPAVAICRTFGGTRSRPVAPDFGPDAPHPTLGATAVGARKPLVAINLLLVTRDVAVARRIAREIREQDGGLPGVRARPHARVGRAAAGVDEPGRPRSHRHRRCVPRRAGARSPRAHRRRLGRGGRARARRGSRSVLRRVPDAGPTSTPPPRSRPGSATAPLAAGRRPLRRATPVS